jgi:DNA-binding transcriptional ArsR family regulator
MGSELYGRVTSLQMNGNLHALSGPAYSALVAMAIVAHDRDTKTSPARLYFAGWELLARTALRRDEYDDAAERAVARAIKQLRDAGLIKSHGRRSGPQSTVVYELTL